MFNALTLAQLSFLAVASASPVAFRHPYHARDQGIQWSACEPNATVPILCGNLSVPLDYTKSNSSDTLTLALRKIPAANSPSKGSILFNFGGPGANGQLDFRLFGSLYLALTGSNHDLIGFDPRGTGDTLRFSCFGSDQERLAALQLVSQLGNSSDVAAGRTWAASKILADTCYAAQKETGDLVGSAFVARDMMQIVDALEEDGLLRYWGLSYGTVLGATVAAMFPDRIDKVVLDGVVNSHEYYTNNEVELFTSTDEGFTGFCTACVANPEACPLARNHTAASLEAQIYEFIDEIKYHPIPLTIPGAPGLLIDYSTVKPVIFNALYAPSTWPTIAGLLDNTFTQNYAAVIEYILNAASAEPAIDDEAQFGIKCGDSYVRTSNFDDVLPILEARHAASRIGGDTAHVVTTLCAQWPFQAKEQYKGDFHVRTKNPMLIIGNTFDPVTPLASAKNMSAGFEGSVLLQHDAYGHCVIGQASLCTAKALRAYFVNGTLPELNTVCEVDVPLFSGELGWDEVIQRLENGE